MVARVMNIPYAIAPAELVDFRRLNQLAQLIVEDSVYVELFYLEEQLIAEFNENFYILDINTPLYDFSRTFNFVVTGGEFRDYVQNEIRNFRLQELHGKTFKQLLENYQLFHLNVVPV
jgi:hypothetical protein